MSELAYSGAMSKHRIVGLGTATAAVLLLALAIPAAVPAHAADQRDTELLARAGEAGQVIVVTAENMSTSYAQLRAYTRGSDGTWKKSIATMPARLGSKGLARDRRQSTWKTPIGTFALPWAFGRKADPGTQLRYVRIDRNDAWPYNPAVPSTYNVFQTAPHDWKGYGSNVERLWSYGRQYDYSIVLDYNLPPGPFTTGANGVRRTQQPANTTAGGGIFLHVTNGGPTAGCIAVSEAGMREILRWLNPAAEPVIVIAAT